MIDASTKTVRIVKFLALFGHLNLVTLWLQKVDCAGRLSCFEDNMERSRAPCACIWVQKREEKNSEKYKISLYVHLK